MSLITVNVPQHLKIDLTIHNGDKEDLKHLKDFLLLIIKNTTTIMTTQAELAQQLTDLSTQLDKVLVEINAEIQKLQDAVNAGGGTTPEVDAAFASLKAKVQTLDDLNPDATV